jgi:hypothetical protein
MPERIHAAQPVERVKAAERQAEEDAVAQAAADKTETVKAKRAQLNAEMDEILDDIETVLDEPALAANFHQVGGE